MRGKVQEMERLCEDIIKKGPPDLGVYCHATWDGAMCWDFTFAGSQAIQPCADYFKVFNPSEFATRECLPDGSWKPNLEINNTDGWTNYTSCLSNNQKPQIVIDQNNHLSRIQLMSEIGYGLSLSSLIVAVTIMIAFKLHCKSNVLHINLFCAFILRASISLFKTLIFVDDIGLEKDIVRNPGGTIAFRQDGTHWECKLIVSLFMYSVATSMMWIFMEGFYLHMLVYKTMFTKRHGTRLYVVVGWFSSLTYVIPWILVRIFKENELCWNRHKTEGYIWIIKAPIYLFTSTAKFVLVLIPLFGVVYIAFYAYPVGAFSMETDFIYLYCEMFYNSFQGFVLALLFCFLNEEVQNEVRRFFFRRKLNSFSTRSIFLSSWRKSSRRMSRDTTRDARNTDCKFHPISNCSDSCKLSIYSQDHATWPRKNHV